MLSGDELYDDLVTSGPILWDPEPDCTESQDCQANLFDHLPRCPWR